ncbi:GxxExxY protein [Chryseobacterium sp. 3008163]|uniref:GxxExxY protein n=1 Tax=Chryseobacterium sp. 3008163 TaxID=2478663 RepID=UPI000F0C011F|nr:GxxExxY protein [Chryseobacterium sp. 3008163]AYN00556.1 GxxExxY protein [Chryseobacterium sp. 3008163]
MTKKQITQLSYEITGLAIKVHRTLGAGLLESIYEKCLVHELNKNGYEVIQQVKIPINYDEITIDADLKIDLLVNDCIIVELKAIEQLLPIHEAQLLTYMKILKKPQGLLINFFTDNITKSLKPFVNEYFRSLPD